MFDQKKIIAGAISGFIAAIIVDLDAWRAMDDGPYDFKVAGRRLIVGVITGALGAIGLGGLVG